MIIEYDARIQMLVQYGFLATQIGLKFESMINI